MQRDDPDDFKIIKHRRVDDTRFAWPVFRGMLLLGAGAGLLGAAAFGFVVSEMIRLAARSGSLAFRLTLTGFLFGGEYSCYRYSHFGSQATHLRLATRGTVVSGILLVPD